MHHGGTVDFVEFLAPDTPVTATWHLTGSGSFKETVPVLDDRGHMVAQEVSRDCEVDLALRWGTGYETEVRSFVNIISTPKGGFAPVGFEADCSRSCASCRDQRRRLKVSTKDSAERIEKDDVLAGLTAVLTVRLAEPQFEGQTKESSGPHPSDHRRAGRRAADRCDAHLCQADEKTQASLLMDKVVAEMAVRACPSRSRKRSRGARTLSRRARCPPSSRLPQRRRRPLRAVHRRW